jgi:hypothetical protein
MEGNGTIQEAGPSRIPFRVPWDRVFEAHERRRPSARESAPGNDAWLPVAPLCFSFSPLDRPYHLSRHALYPDLRSNFKEDFQAGGVVAFYAADTEFDH